jgi:hypothetical protein
MEEEVFEHGVVRTEKTSHFTVISNESLEDSNLSFGARGLLAYLLTKPNHWTVCLQALKKDSPQGITAIRSFIKELEKHGYLHRKLVNMGDGKLGYKSAIYESPRLNPHFYPQKRVMVNYESYLHSDDWKKVRKSALRRAKNRCQLCNKTDGLDVHHRTYENLGKEKPEDVTVLCRECHEKHHNKKIGNKTTAA